MTGRTPEQAAQALLALLRDSATHALVDAAYVHLDHLLTFHRVRSTVASPLQVDPRIPVWLKDKLTAYKVSLAAQQLAMWADLRVLAAALDVADVDWAVIKGPAVAATTYPDLSTREFGDLDLLVDPTRLSDVLHALSGAGAVLLDRNWPAVRQTEQAELTLRARHGTIIDLHWHLLNSKERRGVWRIRTQDVLATRRAADVRGLVIPVLAAEEQMVHLALHAAHSGGHRLQWAVDLRNALRAGVDENRLLAVARSWRADLVLGVMLDRASVSLGGAVSPSVWTAASTASPAWSRVSRRVNRILPMHQSDAGPSGRIWLSATRTSTWDSATEFIGRLRARAGRQVPAESAALHLDVPDMRAREEYLREVAGRSR